MAKNLGPVLLTALIILSSPNQLFAQDACSAAAQKARQGCVSAIQQSHSGGSPIPTSVAAAAASMYLQSQIEIQSLGQAADSCRSDRDSCQTSCNRSPAAFEPASADGGPPAGTGSCTIDMSGGIATIPAGCDPLIVQIGDAPIELTAPANGVMFDALGDHSKFPHIPILISWLTRKSRDSNFFLVLPKENGEVNGIDQLFGNHTRLPDGAYLNNGFETLAFYDGRNSDRSYNQRARNGSIDQKDAIFSRLRLWHDINGDARASSNELFTLEKLGVTSIDLNYDRTYAEQDRFGNRVQYKSTILMSDHQQKLIFDLWFR